MVELKIKKLSDNAVLPTRGSEYSAGLDLYAVGDYEIAPQKMVKVHTGIAAQIPTNYFGAIYARSGMATKRGLRPANAVGVVDSDYRGEIIVALYNDSDEVQTVTGGERIAQLVVTPYVNAAVAEVEELEDTERGAGGFGSTGAK